MVPNLPDGAAAALRRRGRRALRRLQRLALAQPDPSRRCASFILAQRAAAERTRRWPTPSASATRRSRSACAATPRARRMVLRVAHDRARPDADPAAGRADRPGAGLPQRPRGLAAPAPGGRARRGARCGEGSGAAVRRRDADDPRRSRAAAIVRAGGVLLRAGAARAASAPRVAAWLREEARRGLRRRRSSATRRALGLRPGRISLRDPRSRWGSCTASGDLMFSWRLVMAPAAVLDYVVAHEVAHLAELNHSPRFWAVVRRLCPDYRGVARLAAPARRGAAPPRLPARRLDAGRGGAAEIGR